MAKKAPALHIVSKTVEPEPTGDAPTTSTTSRADRTRALAVRLDADRWFRLRQAALVDGRSVQAILVQLIDQWLDETRGK